MYFTLAISAATRHRCAALVSAAQDTDPRVMPVPGPARLAWRAPDERTAVLYWGSAGSSGPAPPTLTETPAAPDRDRAGASHAGTIWISPARAVLRARTGLARVDPVYLAETPGAVVVSDRACWAAAVTGRLGDHDPVMAGAFLSLGYPTGAATPFRGVRALDGDHWLRVTAGRAAIAPPGGRPAGAGDAGVAAALVAAVRPLAEQAVPVELSLTGGKDSRLIAAALAAAEVPFRARTHGFANHPDVIIARLIAERLGLEHTVTEPRAAAAGPDAKRPKPPDQAEVLGRLRSAVLVSDGMLSAFENIGSWVRPDHAAAVTPVQAGGHGGELLRGGYAQTAWRSPASRRPVSAAQAWSSAAGAELFRRLTTRRLGLLRPDAAAAYLASLAPWAAAVGAGPLRALDDFYLANRAGRWSAAARQAYLIRAPLVQPFFSDQVIQAARAVPLRQRMNDQLHRDVLASLAPELLDLPLAEHPWHGQRPTADSVLTAPPGPSAPPDWRRSQATTGFLREYVLDTGGSGRVFGIVSRRAAERALQPPLADPQAAWSLATLAALLSGDWRNARQPRP
jgi:asparagine synthase (glutamine-hydrolysing)